MTSPKKPAEPATRVLRPRRAATDHEPPTTHYSQSLLRGLLQNEGVTRPLAPEVATENAHGREPAARAQPVTPLSPHTAKPDDQPSRSALAAPDADAASAPRPERGQPRSHDGHDAERTKTLASSLTLVARESESRRQRKRIQKHPAPILSTPWFARGECIGAILLATLLLGGWQLARELWPAPVSSAAATTREGAVTAPPTTSPQIPSEAPDLRDAAVAPNDAAIARPAVTPAAPDPRPEDEARAHGRPAPFLDVAQVTPTQAITWLSTGEHDKAQAAYVVLAQRFPDDPAYAFIAQDLEALRARLCRERTKQGGAACR